VSKGGEDRPVCIGLDGGDARCRIWLGPPSGGSTVVSLYSVGTDDCFDSFESLWVTGDGSWEFLNVTSSCRWPEMRADRRGFLLSSRLSPSDF